MSNLRLHQVDVQEYLHPSKTNMTMEHPPFEDVFPIEYGDFPASHVSFQGCIPLSKEGMPFCQGD